MIKQRIILIGAGGHSKSVADSIDAEQYALVGFLDNYKTGTHWGAPIFGKDPKDVPDYKSYKYFVSIGDVKARKMWYEKLQAYGLETVNIIDKTAIISPSAKIGTGNFIGKYAIINADAVIGDNNVINTRALVEHECVVGSHTHLSTGSVINGNVVVEDEVFFGSCAVCNGQMKIGHGAIVGSGSVVIGPVEADTTVVGVPAKMIKRRG